MPLTTYSVEDILRRVAWTVEVTDEFEAWWNGLVEDERVSIDGMIRVLERHGPAAVGPPFSTAVTGSRYSQLQQLRVPHHGTEICVFYIGDESRATLVLLTGSKAGPGPGICPPEQIQLADGIYLKYLSARRDPQ